MNEEEILSKIYKDLSHLSTDEIKYPDYDTMRKRLKKYLNSIYGISIAKELGEDMNEGSKKHTFIFSEPVYVKEGEVIKEVNMAGILNAQVQEWYKKNVDLLSVIDKLTTRCGKLEEENENLKLEFDTKVKVVKELNDRLESLDRNLRFSKSTITDLNHCIAEKRVKNRELKQKLDEITGLNNCNNLDKKAIFTSLGVNDTRSALDKIMEMKKLIKQNEEEKQNLKDEVKAAVSREEVAKKNLEWRTHEVTDLNNCLAQKNATIKELRRVIKQHEEDGYLIDQQRKKDATKYEDLQEAYDNCVNECSDHINEINSLLQNLEVETVEQGIEKIKLLKDGCLITFNFSAEADLRLENEKLKKKVEDLRKDVKFEFDHRMEVLAASTDQEVKIAILKKENTRLKNFIKDRTNDIHEMSEEIEKRLAKYRKEEEEHEL